MKRTLSLICAVAVMFSLFACLHANALGVTHCVTFILYPEKQGNKHYEMVNYQQYDQILPPTREAEATYETEENYYEFLGWDGFPGKTDKERAVKVYEYFDTKPGIPYYEPYEAKPLPLMGDEDLVLHAVFRLMPKRYDIDKNRTFDVKDVTYLLDNLRSPQKEDVCDVTTDGIVNIRDVTALINFLATAIF